MFSYQGFCRLALVVLVFGLNSLATFAQKPNTVGDLADQGTQQSKLTLSGSAPFHLQVKISEKDSPDSDYQGEIEEYWVAPDKWRRSIKTPDFSQLRIMNGEKVLEQNSGDYFPHWLDDFVTALLDPLPFANALSSANTPVRAGTNCARFATKVGAPPSTNSVFTVVCFEGKQQLLGSVVSPTYEADFKEYKPFEGKIIARYISQDPEPGTHIEARITELVKLLSPPESLFAIDTATPIEQQIRTANVSEDSFRNLGLGSATIHWPTVRDGKTKGTLSVLVRADRNGKVRETWGLNSDNPWMTDAARKQLLDWKLKPATMNGTPVQVESILTFAFDTTIENPYPVLNNEEARKQAIHIVEPKFPSGAAPSRTEFVVRLPVNEIGEVIGLENIANVPTQLLLAVNVAVRDWKFKPLVVDGKPTEFFADLKFLVP